MCLSDAKASTDILSKALEGLSPKERPKRIINLATIYPEEAKKLHQIAREKNVAYLDVAFVGGIPSVESRSSFFIVAGDSYEFSHTISLLQRLGKSIMYVGTEIGEAQKYKAVNQYVSSAHHLILAETVAYAKLWKIPVQDIRSTLFNNIDDPSNLSMNWAIFHKFDLTVNDSFNGHHSVRNFLKDLEIIAAIIPKSVKNDYLFDLKSRLDIVINHLFGLESKGLGEQGHHCLYQMLLKRRFYIHKLGTDKIPFRSWAKVHLSLLKKVNTYNRRLKSWNPISRSLVPFWYTPHPEFPEQADLPTRKILFVLKEIKRQNSNAFVNALIIAKSLNLDEQKVIEMLRGGTGCSNVIRFS